MLNSTLGTDWYNSSSSVVMKPATRSLIFNCHHVDYGDPRWSFRVIYRNQQHVREWGIVSSLPSWWNVGQVSRRGSSNASRTSATFDYTRHFQWCRARRDASPCKEESGLEKFRDFKFGEIKKKLLVPLIIIFILFMSFTLVLCFINIVKEEGKYGW